MVKGKKFKGKKLINCNNKKEGEMSNGYRRGARRKTTRRRPSRRRRIVRRGILDRLFR